MKKTLIIENSGPSYGDAELIEQIKNFLTGEESELVIANGAVGIVLFQSLAKKNGVNPLDLKVIFENGEESLLDKNFRYTNEAKCNSLDLIFDSLMELI